EYGDAPTSMASCARIAPRGAEVSPAGGEEVDTGADPTASLCKAGGSRWDPVGRDLAHHGATQRGAKGLPVEHCRHRAAHVRVFERGHARVQRNESDLPRRWQGDLRSMLA